MVNGRGRGEGGGGGGGGGGGEKGGWRWEENWVGGAVAVALIPLGALYIFLCRSVSLLLRGMFYEGLWFNFVSDFIYRCREGFGLISKGVQPQGWNSV
jgi:hypothetical protein